MRALPTLLAWLAALASLLATAASARGVRASLDALPAPEWRGAPLRAPVAPEPESEQGEPRELPAPERVDGAYALDLARLAFDDYDSPALRLDPAPLGPEDYPPAIRDFHGEEVLVSGFPQALELDGERVRLLRLTRFPPGCCFGALPQYDEWVLVAFAGDGLPNPDAYAELRVRGTLELGEELDESGVLESLYRLQDARAR